MAVSLVIGIGNAYRSDDGAGIAVARRLEESGTDLTVLEASGEGTALMQAWQGADRVILVDAVRSAARPGTVHRLDAAAASLPAHFFHYSTHAFGVAEAVELARVMAQLPPELIVYGIEGECFEAGTRLSTVVERAVTTVVARIRREEGARVRA